MLLITLVGAVFDHVGVVDRFVGEEWSVPLAKWMIVGEWFKWHRWLMVGLWGVWGATSGGEGWWHPTFDAGYLVGCLSCLPSAFTFCA